MKSDSVGGETRPSVCIVSHNAYGAMSGGQSGHIGGVERQTSLLAKWLARKGRAVSMLTWDEGGPAVEMMEGVRVIKIAPRQAGIPGLRFFHPRWTGLVRAMRAANAEIYYHNCAEVETGQIALWCRGNRRSFVFYSANDPDCDPALPGLKNFRDRAFYRYGLRSADQLIVQTKKQQAMLKNGFGLEALVLPMPCPDPAASLPPAAGPRSGRVLWLARACRQKRPDRLLDLAEACPEIGFDLVGPFYADAYAQGVLRRAQGIGNVTVHGAAGRDRVAVFYQNAACLCNTSDYEGFPNTFLEAWSWGLPVVSMFDPDSLLAGKNLGLAVADIPAMAGAVRSLLASPGRWEEISRNARQYFVENHRVETVLPKFEDVFAAVARRRN